MCGIHGFNFEDKGLAESMVRSCQHRGPDDNGVFVKNGFSLGNNRLAIIDLSPRGHQPMVSIDGSKVIIFNGEIYNFKVLKNELEQKGYKFNSDTDTEVILNLFIEEGEKCTEKLNGIFAFAIFDVNTKQLFLARDPLGVKPLYYWLDKGKFIFSSEIKAILEHNIPRLLNLESFNHYLRVLYVPEPLTMFKGIFKFPAASFGWFKDSNLNITRYWPKDRATGENMKGRDLVKLTEEKVCRAVQSQLISDKPLGIYLSGGIDSSIILDCAARVRNSIDTFSVGFKLSQEEESEKFNADFNLARQTSAFYKTNHHEVLLSPQEVPDLLEKAVWSMDEPISNPTALAMYKLASFAKKHVDVTLSGDGGDELFGGYPRFKINAMASWYSKLPSPLRGMLNFHPTLSKLNTEVGIDRYALLMFQKDEILKRTINTDKLDLQISYNFFRDKYFKEAKEKNFEELFMKVYRSTWLKDYSLMLADKLSMASSLEVRVPFLDKELVEFADQIPVRSKVSPFNTKIILKQAFANRLPKHLFDQPKRGWFSPGAKWLRHSRVFSKIKDTLSPNFYSETSALLEWPAISDILSRHKNKEQYNLTIIWALATFQVWAHNFQVKLE